MCSLSSFMICFFKIALHSSSLCSTSSKNTLFFSFSFPMYLFLISPSSVSSLIVFPRILLSSSRSLRLSSSQHNILFSVESYQYVENSQNLDWNQGQQNNFSSGQDCQISVSGEARRQHEIQFPYRKTNANKRK